MKNTNQQKVLITDIPMGQFFFLPDSKSFLHMKKLEKRIKKVVENIIIATTKDLENYIGTTMNFSKTQTVIPVKKNIVEFNTLSGGDNYILLDDDMLKMLRIYFLKNAAMNSYIKPLHPRSNLSIAQPDGTTKVILLPKL